MSLVVGAAPQRSFLGIAGGIIGAVGGFVTGGPGGALAGATAGQKIGDAIAGSPRSTPPVGSTGGAQTFGGGGGFAGGGSGRSFGGDVPTVPPNVPNYPIPGVMLTPSGSSCSPMRMAHYCGYHWNKHTYCTVRSGVVPAYSRQVRNRRMNPLNIKALRRADRRAHAFLKISGKVVKHFVAKRPKGKAFISARRKRK